MAHVVLFHHAQGLTPGIAAFAAELGDAGHTVSTPDLYDGRTFPDLESGIAHAREVGFDQLLDRGVAAGSALPSDVVYAGFSLGVMPAAKLVQTRPGARGALFYDACLPMSEFGAWPADLPAQVHGSEQDEFFAEDLPCARELAGARPSTRLFLYPRQRHLFADSSLEAYDAGAAAAVTSRTLEFLAGLD